MMAKQICAKITKICEGSPASRVGVQPGDELLSIDSKPVRDILDYQYLSAEERFEVRVRRDGQDYAYSITKDAEEDLGLEFEEELFDGLHTCRNKCIFCFLGQMPKGLRQSLYVRDDDYRLSFAHGNYITLTNLSDEDMDRICSQRMSPLYISVHATDPSLRADMFRNENAGRIMEQLRMLAEARITMHTQIVLCPGVNDGEHLERSIRDLSSLYPRVASIAIVPVGLTKHRAKLAPLRPVDGETARQVINLCVRRQKEFKSRYGTRLVFPSDEFYLLSGMDFPSSRAYEGFPQLEDGVGVSRIFLDELGKVSRYKNRRLLKKRSYVLVTGVLATPLVRRFADVLNEFDGVSARVCTVKNNFLGKTVTVAGLLAGQDIAAALKGVSGGEEILIPSVALKDDLFLDDMKVSELQNVVGRRITVVPASPWEAVRRLAVHAE